MRLHGFARPLVLALLPLLLAGCELLLGGMFGGGAFPGPSDGAFPEPSVRATYTSGTATIAVTRGGVTETVNLDRLAPGAQLTSLIGADLAWRNDEGWGIGLMAYDGGAFGGIGANGGELTIQRVTGTEFWTTADFTAMNRCIVDIAELSESGVSGTATCRGLRWIDGLSGRIGLAGEPAYVDGQEPFDAEVTFEAH